MPLHRLLLLTIAVVLAWGAPAEAAACDRVADPFGSDAAAGTATAPFRTAQRLAMSLDPGETGCLRSGTYADEVSGTYVLNIKRSGTPGAPITIRSVPGERATLRGIVQVPNGYHDIVVEDLDIDGRRLPPNESTSIQIQAEDVTLQDNTITNQGQAICIVLGAHGWGRAIRTVVQRNVFHDCGAPGNKLEHSVYVAEADGTLITDNIMLRSGGYGVHLYPDAHDTTVSHNVMVGGGGGVIFAGEGDAASSDSLVEKNVITDSLKYSAVRSFWGGTAVGTSNFARDNCVIRNKTVQVDIANQGFTPTNNIIADPGFRDPAAGDYRMAAGSPCLNVVEYDTAARLQGDPDQPPVPSPSPSPSASPNPSPSVTAAPTATPAVTPPPGPAATPSPGPGPTPPVPEIVPDGPPSVTVGTQPEPDPNQVPVEAAEVYVDDAAFSASGGQRKRCRPHRRRCAR